MEKEKKRCEYERLDGKTCPYQYYHDAPDPNTNEVKGWCVFHHPIDEGNYDKSEDFKLAFEELIRKARFTYYPAKGAGDGRQVPLDCEGFIFPDIRIHVRPETFGYPASFERAIFANDVVFLGSRFTKGASFERATFKGRASFHGASFGGNTTFWGATFEDSACFTRTEFKWGVEFGLAFFLKRADFRGVYFGGETVFEKAVFYDDADFSDCRVFSVLKFAGTEFFGAISLRDIDTAAHRVDGKVSNDGNVIFNYVYFHRPDLVLMGGERADLGRWSFAGTNIERANFVREKWNYINRRYFLSIPITKKRKTVFDEELAIMNEQRLKAERKTMYIGPSDAEGETEEEHGLNPQVTWLEAEAVYRRLRKNYEGTLAYDIASDFHYGQLECRRRAAKRYSLEWVTTNLYKWFAGYGESYLIPCLWFLSGVLIFFPAILLWAGVPDPSGNTGTWCLDFTNGVMSWSACAAAFFYGVKTVVSLRVDGAPLGFTIIANIERLYAIVTATFFILALRRRFKR